MYTVLIFVHLLTAFKLHCDLCENLCKRIDKLLNVIKFSEQEQLSKNYFYISRKCAVKVGTSRVVTATFLSRPTLVLPSFLWTQLQVEGGLGHCRSVRVNCTLYSTLYSVQTTEFTVHCTLYTVHCSTVHCKMYTVRFTQYTVHCGLLVGF